MLNINLRDRLKERRGLLTFLQLALLVSCNLFIVNLYVKYVFEWKIGWLDTLATTSLAVFWPIHWWVKEKWGIDPDLKGSRLDRFLVAPLAFLGWWMFVIFILIEVSKWFLS